ncbi:MAG TPA: hypothetical protein VHS09_13675 [Polyangiaceae bacterium]|nr:hypothetical protein [Polyangiaceae bacterium]
MLASACANGGNDSSASDGGGVGGEGGVLEGGDATLKGDGPHPGDSGGEGSTSGTSAAKACADNAGAYCTQLNKCAPFLVTTQYGDELTCEAAQAPGCMDALAAPGTGWTGDVLEACVNARTALSCADFLHAKPQPTACFVTGLFTGQACLYDAQCGTGYCRIASGASCGNCVALGNTGAPCTSSNDCGGNLLCAGAGTCQPPSPASGMCSATAPCTPGTACIGGVCVVPGGSGAACVAKNNSADCDYYQGVYCDGTTSMCASYAVAMAGDSCASATPTVCAGDATCYQSLCVAPASMASACNAASGLNCAPPYACLGADGGTTCTLFSASQCK